MKLNEQKKLGIFYLALGIVLFLIGLCTDSSQENNWFLSIGCGIVAIGIVRLLRVARLSCDPNRAADYEASLQDERTAYVANKARSLAFFLCIYAQLAAALVAIVWFHQPLIGKVLCLLTCVQTIVYTVSFWYYNSKY